MAEDQLIRRMSKKTLDSRSEVEFGTKMKFRNTRWPMQESLKGEVSVRLTFLYLLVRNQNNLILTSKYKEVSRTDTYFPLQTSLADGLVSDISSTEVVSLLHIQLSWFRNLHLIV